MGPGYNVAARGSAVPYSEAGGSVDYVAEIRKMVAAHPTLTYLRPLAPGAPYGATWDDDEGSHKVTFDDLRDLYRFLALRFGAR